MKTLLAVLVFCSVASAHFGDLLKGLTEAQRKELGDIIRNQDLTKAQIHQAMKDWAAKQSEETQKSFEQHEKKHEEMRKKRDEYHAEKMKSASPEAKALDEQIRAIHKDEKLTRKQSCERINEIIKGAEEKVKTELHLRERDCDKPFSGPRGQQLPLSKGGKLHQRLFQRHKRA